MVTELNGYMYIVFKSLLYIGICKLYYFSWKIFTKTSSFLVKVKHLSDAVNGYFTILCRTLLVIGTILMLYSAAVDILRMSSLHLLDRDTYIAWFTSYNESYLTELKESE